LSGISSEFEFPVPRCRNCAGNRICENDNREAPALLVVGADGKGTMTNYPVNNQTYIVDRLFDRARLVLGGRQESTKGGD
jgi:type IV secretory pathway VirB9-like protein